MDVNSSGKEEIIHGGGIRRKICVRQYHGILKSKTFLPIRYVEI